MIRATPTLNSGVSQHREFHPLKSSAIRVLRSLGCGKSTCLDGLRSEPYFGTANRHSYPNWAAVLSADRFMQEVRRR
jgi:hypothetical protein